MLQLGCIIAFLLFLIAFIKSRGKFKEESMKRKNTYKDLPSKDEILLKAKSNAEQLKENKNP